jgi:autotransporter strand-loop-strand O-heptosyltransferase
MRGKISQMRRAGRHRSFGAPTGGSIDTGNILFETEIKAGRVNSTKRYFVRARLEIWANGKSVFSHDYSAANRDVLVQLPVGTLGDPMGWFPYAVKFKERHGCRLTCLMSDKLIPLFRGSYPDIALPCRSRCFDR